MRQSSLHRGWAAAVTALAVGLGGCGCDDDETVERDAGTDSGPPLSPEQRLRADADGALALTWLQDRLATLSGRVPLPAEAGTDPEERARWFAERYADALGLSDPAAQLALDAVTEIADDDKIVVAFHRVAEGLRVAGSDLRVHLADDGAVSWVAAVLPGDVSVTTTPSLDETEAGAAAIAGLALAAGEVVGSVELVIHDAQMFDDDASGSRLAWEVHVADYGVPTAAFAWVDAETGDLLDAAGELPSVRDRATFTANNQEDMDAIARGPSEQWFDESGALAGATPDQQGRDAHDFVGAAFDYYFDRFGRDGWDDEGTTIPSYVHYHTTADNAFFSDGSFWFMTDFVAYDIVVHELTHGVVEASGGLRYQRQPGALNESFADVFAVFASPEGDGRWTIGEDLRGAALSGPFRDFADPTRFDQPRHMSEFMQFAAPPGEGNDWGAVHYNSGIPNHAVWLLVNGGEQRDSHRWVCPIEEAKAERLVYRVLYERYLPPTARFRHYRAALAAECRDGVRFGAVYELADCQSVLEALFAVGIGEPDSDGDGWPDDEDPCFLGYDPDRLDGDGDGVEDACASGEAATEPRTCHPTVPEYRCPATFVTAEQGSWPLDSQFGPAWNLGDHVELACSYRAGDGASTASVAARYLVKPQAPPPRLGCAPVGPCEIACTPDADTPVRAVGRAAEVTTSMFVGDPRPEAELADLADQILGDIAALAITCP